MLHLPRPSRVSRLPAVTCLICDSANGRHSFKYPPSIQPPTRHGHKKIPFRVQLDPHLPPLMISPSNPTSPISPQTMLETVEPSTISSKVTSWLSSPYVCERMAY
ncbi:hypothetical protein K432DRAFT_386433 [Lepidopterella palustris CBS 459.81]|uniref:Uncharacterized protein n=1 Tax=Lepidopterella palustris CBS 459.81 TaxID=1314670 RepID=A0A8E2E0S3_9PEZI|nr:hypothetical protein K432DRAFT_386433 [Lepidopterella palustris CBS 459.81]